MRLRNDVVALYVDPRGPYPKLVSQWYDEARDARTYDGELPVVAHPPCGPYSRLKHFNRHQRPELAVHAVALVRRLGGVLEHPKASTLWSAAGLPPPNTLPDEHGGWTLDVDQVRWGHPALKATWLYIVGCAREALPPIPPTRDATHSLTACRESRKKLRERGVLQASAEQRRRTPVDFANFLIEIAAQCRKEAR